MTVGIHVFPDHETASRALTERMLAHVKAHPQAVMALPSGNTPLRLYELLAEAERAAQAGGDGPLFAQVTVFALDEYWGLGRRDPRSFAAFFERHVFGPLGIRADHRHMLNGQAADPVAEAAAYEAAIARAGGLDLSILGLGANGHIAFNEPAATLSVCTHLVDLVPPASEVARLGITMGVGTLLSAPNVWLIATGDKKAPAVQRMLNGRVDPQLPASFLQLHPGADVFLDTSAAGDTFLY